MKKISCLLIISISLLWGCHSNNLPADSTSQNTAPLSDTTKKQPAATPPQADTNIKNGPLIKYYTSGVIKEKSYYIAGRRSGECQSFYPNGKLWSDDYFTNGMLDGATTSYYDNGQKRYEGTFTKGKPTGQWKYYDETGKLVRTTDYSQKQAM